MNIDLLTLVPNPFICREVKLLYRSNRLIEFFAWNGAPTYREHRTMALTKFERMFVSWAIKHHHRTTERERLKQEMIEYAITGRINNQRTEDSKEATRKKDSANSAHANKSLSNVAVFGVEYASKFTSKEEDNRNKITNPQPPERIQSK